MITDIEKLLTEAGFEDVIKFCSAYIVRIPNKKITAIISINKEKIYYSGTFQAEINITNKKELINWLKNIIKRENENDLNKTFGNYDDIIKTTDGYLVSYLNGRVRILVEGNTVKTIIVDGQSYTTDIEPQIILSIINNNEDETDDKKIKKIEIFLMMT